MASNVWWSSGSSGWCVGSNRQQHVPPSSLRVNAVLSTPRVRRSSRPRRGAVGHRPYPDAVRIEPLAQAPGVTRGGFYWHFEDRGALLDEMLDTWERASTEEVIERVETRGGDVGSKLRRAGALTFSDWLLPIDLAVRDWARREPAVAERLRRVDNRRMDYLRSLFRTFCADPDDVEARSMLAFSALIGSHFMVADHGGRPRRRTGTGRKAPRGPIVHTARDWTPSRKGGACSSPPLSRLYRPAAQPEFPGRDQRC